jgi:hypothetical protein
VLTPPCWPGIRRRSAAVRDRAIPSGWSGCRHPLKPRMVRVARITEGPAGGSHTVALRSIPYRRASSLIRPHCTKCSRRNPSPPLHVKHASLPSSITTTKPGSPDPRTPLPTAQRGAFSTGREGKFPPATTPCSTLGAIVARSQHKTASWRSTTSGLRCNRSNNQGRGEASCESGVAHALIAILGKPAPRAAAPEAIARRTSRRLHPTFPRSREIRADARRPIRLDHDEIFRC